MAYTLLIINILITFLTIEHHPSCKARSIAMALREMNKLDSR